MPGSPSAAPAVPLTEWGSRVAEARRSLGLSQRDVALASAVTQQTISKVERGLVCPHDTLKLRLAVALRRPPEALFPWPVLATGEDGVVPPV